MKKILLVFIILTLASFVYADDYGFTNEELEWIESHKEQLTLGLDPFSGMDFFVYKDGHHGYLVDLVNLINQELSLNIHIVSDRTWSEVFEGIKTKEIDILFGANKTEDRLKYMAFTEPIYEYPYAIFIRKNDDVKTLGDLDKRTIGFLEDDIAIELFSNAFQNIAFDIIEYPDQYDGLDALNDYEIDGFITSGGGIRYDFVYHYPSVKLMTEIEDITSEMTLSSHRDHEIMVSIFSKFIHAHRDEINDYVGEAQILYNRKILQLTEEELSWFDDDGVAVVGIVEDYLPFDYYSKGEYLGIAGAIIESIQELIGIEFEYVYGTFDEVYELSLEGKVDLLNMAKTADREEIFIFPRSFREERDIIYGDRDMPSVNDIYGLEGKKVAVIEGFWHQEMLEKSLRDIEIIKTDNIQASLELITKGKVDYFIENPTVAEYYISGLGYDNVVKKGETSADSFLYFGIPKSEKAFAGIIDKTLILIDYEKVKEKGLNSVPKLVTKSVRRLLIVIAFLMIILTIGIYLLIRALRSLITEKETSARLKERSALMYIDSLTGLNNRLYFNSMEESLKTTGFPQAIIISDLNKLKHINDTYGHHVGDEYIRIYGEVLREVFKSHLVCRMGGDEFLVIMTHTTEHEVKKEIDRLKELLKNCRIKASHEFLVGVDVAIGFSMRYEDQELERMMILADDKMYQNKSKS